MLAVASHFRKDVKRPSDVVRCVIKMMKKVGILNKSIDWTYAATRIDGVTDKITDRESLCKYVAAKTYPPVNNCPNYNDLIGDPTMNEVVCIVTRMARTTARCTCIMRVSRSSSSSNHKKITRYGRCIDHRKGFCYDARENGSSAIINFY